MFFYHSYNLSCDNSMLTASAAILFLKKKKHWFYNVFGVRERFSDTCCWWQEQVSENWFLTFLWHQKPYKTNGFLIKTEVAALAAR